MQNANKYRRMLTTGNVGVEDRHALDSVSDVGVPKSYSATPRQLATKNTVEPAEGDVD